MIQFRKAISILFTALVLTSVRASGSETDRVYVSFDSHDTPYQVLAGAASLEKSGAKKGQALKLSSDSQVGISLMLKSNSIYRLTLWLRTESGADNVSMQLTGRRYQYSKRDIGPGHLDKS